MCCANKTPTKLKKDCIKTKLGTFKLFINGFNSNVVKTKGKIYWAITNPKIKQEEIGYFLKLLCLNDKVL